jgi:hypothetical protein
MLSSLIETGVFCIYEVVNVGGMHMKKYMLQIAEQVSKVYPAAPKEVLVQWLETPRQPVTGSLTKHKWQSHSEDDKRFAAISPLWFIMEVLL